MTIIHYKNLPKNITNGTEVSIDNNKVTASTHGFHKYPGKFILQIPEWAIKSYLRGENKIVLDPFVGSGTTVVEGISNGYNSYGIDIDPLSCLISKVKSTPIDQTIFSNISHWIMDNVENAKPLFNPKTDNLNHWFTNEAIIKLSKLRTLIDDIPNKFSSIDNIDDYYDAFIIAFSGIIRRVSNADNQSQKTYVSGTKVKKPAEVYSLFQKQLNLFVNGFKELNDRWNKKSKSIIIKSDGNPDFSKILPTKVDLIVTSPPYIKSIDYVYNQMVELFWIGDLFDMNTQTNQNKKRRKYTGTTLIPKKEYSGFLSKKDNFNIPLLDNSITEVLKDNKNGEKHAYIIYKYFSFMKEHFNASEKVLNDEGHYVMAIGNSKVSNVEIPTADILISIANDAGFTLENRWSYVIKNHFMGFDRKNHGGKIKIDHMLIFKKNN